VHLILNGVALDVATNTLSELIGPLPEGHAVAVNSEVVPRAQCDTRQLADGDMVDVVTAVAGG
jgi:sulfur carrier protein